MIAQAVKLWNTDSGVECYQGVLSSLSLLLFTPTLGYLSAHRVAAIADPSLASSTVQAGVARYRSCSRLISYMGRTSTRT